MKKAWSYISFILTGIILGIIIGAKWIGGDDYKAYIKKIKQRGEGESSQGVVFKPFDSVSGKSNRELRQEKKDAKMAKKLQRRNLRKK